MAKKKQKSVLFLRVSPAIKKWLVAQAKEQRGTESLSLYAEKLFLLVKENQHLHVSLR